MAGTNSSTQVSPAKEAQESDLLSQKGAAPDGKLGGSPCWGDTECFGEKAGRGFL